MFSGGDQSKITKRIGGTKIHKILQERYQNETGFVIAGRAIIFGEDPFILKLDENGDLLPPIGIINISEIPYWLNKSSLVEKIADLVRDKVIVWISDLRDESDKSGMRVVIELKRGENPDVILNNLYRFLNYYVLQFFDNILLDL